MGITRRPTHDFQDPFRESHSYETKERGGEMPQAALLIDIQSIDNELERFRSPPPTVEGDHGEVPRLLESIHRDPFDSELNVKQLKARCRVRDNNVSSRFRRALGITVKDYIERLRMRAACHLLSFQSVTVFDIALSVGYYHPQTFYNVFRRHLGCTPTVYRERLATSTLEQGASPRQIDTRSTEAQGAHP